MDAKKIVKIVFIIILCLSVVLNIALAVLLVKTVNNCNQSIASLASKNQILDFTQMFVQKILMANQDIDFDTRLELETEVRNLNDQDILAQWQKFTKSTTKTDASNEAKNLLELLVKKSLEL